MMNQTQKMTGANYMHEEYSRLQDTAAIVVTYNPNPDGLQRGLREIARQVACVIVVDNASHNLAQCQIDQLGRALDIRLETVRQQKNVGVGAGFNAGIDVADKLGYPFVVLFDQDSIPQEGMVCRLRQSYESLTASGVRVAAVGPRFREPGDGTLSNFIPSDDGNTKRPHCQEGGGTIMTDFLISSGSFIPMQAIGEVGMMDESLFIDYVDAEWCLRATAKGWFVYGVNDAIMQHSIGESRKHFWFVRWRNIAFHKPFRYYYIFRNSWLLRKHPYISSGWKRLNRRHNVMLAVYLVALAPNRIANLKMILKGILDGCKGISGPMRTT